MQPGLNTPIDDQGFTRCPQPRPATPMMITTPLRLHLRHQPAEVARRPHIASRLGRRQQPLRRNPARRPGDPFSHQIRHPIEVPAPRLPLRLFTRLMCLDDLLHRLVGSAAHPSRTPIRAHISVGSKHIHPFPRVLHNGDPPSAAAVTGSHRHREPRKGLNDNDTRTKNGDFHWPPAGTATWPPVGTFSWPRTLGGTSPGAPVCQTGWSGSVLSTFDTR